MNKLHKIGLALSGGGIKGLCHLGALKAMNEYGISPDIISGVSAGGVIGALYADGYSPEEIADFFIDISFFHFTKIRTPGSNSLFQIEPFEDFLGKKLRAKTFHDLKIPLNIVATDLDNDKDVVFSSGELLPCIIASCSIPVLFPPRQIDGVNYVDGGLLKNFPVSTIRSKCKTLIGVNASPMITSSYKTNLMTIATRSYHFIFKANVTTDKKLCDILIEPTDMAEYDTFDTDKALDIFQLGYKSAKEIIEKLQIESC